jgi:hypothetical protein
VVAVRFLAARRWGAGCPSRTATSGLADEAYAIAALHMPWGNCGSGTARSPRERSPSRQWLRRIVRRRTRPDVIPSAPVQNAGQSVVASWC